MGNLGVTIDVTDNVEKYNPEFPMVLFEVFSQVYGDAKTKNELVDLFKKKIDQQATEIKKNLPNKQN